MVVFNDIRSFHPKCDATTTSCLVHISPFSVEWTGPLKTTFTTFTAAQEYFLCMKMIGIFIDCLIWKLLPPSLAIYCTIKTKCSHHASQGSLIILIRTYVMHHRV